MNTKIIDEAYKQKLTKEIIKLNFKLNDHNLSHKAKNLLITQRQQLIEKLKKLSKQIPIKHEGCEKR
ncbi:hypothetical protein [Streptococcus phage phiKSM96]|nr:hypothetical protein [Streptococcus mutans]WGL32751.1 hypothetical protein [Streptococcus phage phiKSM96]